MIRDDVYLGLLAGGRGQRLGGVDKASLRTSDGESYAQRLVRVLGPRVAAVRVALRAEQDLDLPGVEVVRDRRPERGPLGGLDALLWEAPRPWCWLVAVDMPRLVPQVLDALMAGDDGQARVLVPAREVDLSPGRFDRGWHPTCGLYAAELAPRVESALADGITSLHAFVASVSHRVLQLPAPLHDALHNVNHPADLSRQA